MSSLVSICIPTYNGEKYLNEALESVKSQTYKNIEVIISDDSSTDSTLEICNKFKNEVDFPVHIYSHKPSGIGANWNYTIEKANGDYIKFLFQDDVMESECILKMMFYLINHNLEIVACKRSIIDEDSNEIINGDWYKNYGDLQKAAGIEVKDFFIISKKNLRKLDYHHYSKNNIIGEPCVSIFSKKLVKKIGLFNIHLKQILDYEYWLRVLVYYKIGIIEEKLMKFRFHSQQTSTINFLQNVNEGSVITNHLFGKFLMYIDFKTAKHLLVQKYTLLKKIALIRYKIFP
ncbi:hypothetical protein AR438_03650 [Chryseobacterium aquaticum]|uniref:Glycosyltransferase 2-like domain-containing protein n=1 Tax=Chryseobacterium aquaticum TaxID=452084 RepID=A0A0Q3HWU6_9FLAO|nr:glycosyltransferase [Chryseobacterium aquaticum]KQK27312.1 hypothetical protein AR438_03650 [Chryseobacterium aquaticum]